MTIPYGPYAPRTRTVKTGRVLGLCGHAIAGSRLADIEGNLVNQALEQGTQHPLHRAGIVRQKLERYAVTRKALGVIERTAAGRVQIVASSQRLRDAAQPGFQKINKAASGGLEQAAAHALFKEVMLHVATSWQRMEGS